MTIIPIDIGIVGTSYTYNVAVLLRKSEGLFEV